MMRAATLALALSAIAGGAYAQSTPAFITGQVPTAVQWNSYFGTKVDTVGGVLSAPTLSGVATFTGSIRVGGTTQAFPASGLLVGTTDTQTLSGKTLVAPFVGGSVNGLTLAAGTTGNATTITAGGTGSDTNISINLVPKGTGTVQISGVPLTPVFFSSSNTSAGSTAYNGQVGNGQSLNIYNTAFGFGALNALVNAQENTAFGNLALNLQTSGAGNTAFGHLALPISDLGSFNTAIGSATLRYFSGNHIGNTAVGHGALAGDDTAPLNNTTGDNTAIGGWAGQEITTGGNNTLVGAFAGVEIQTGQENAAVGLYANAGCSGCVNNIPGVTASSFNAALGAYALENNTANALVAVGYKALQHNTTGVENVGVGFQSLQALTTATSNTAVGHDTLYQNVSSNSNTAIGDRALSALTTGTGQNVAIGTHAAQQLTTGANTVAIGHNTMFGDPIAPVAYTGAGNVSVGPWTGAELSTGTNSVFIGNLAGIEVQTGTANVALGTWALAGCASCSQPTIGAVTAASNNVAIGYQTLMNAVSNGQTAVGYNALTASANINDVRNAAFGFQALLALNNATDVTAIGANAGSTITTGNHNTVIGSGVASTTLTTGLRNILIGTNNNCDTPASGTNDTLLVCASTGATQLLSGNLAAGSLALTVNGAFTATSYSAGASAGVDCASGVTAGTVVVVKGIVTHC